VLFRGVSWLALFSSRMNRPYVVVMLIAPMALRPQAGWDFVIDMNKFLHGRTSMFNRGAQFTCTRVTIARLTDGARLAGAL
jgi:hypothetical protein